MSLIANEPLRAVRWRWDRATILSKQDRIQATELDDDKIVDAAKYIKRYRAITERALINENADVDADLLALRKEWPDLMAAASVYVSGEFMKWAIEALVCAGASAETIAEPFGVKPSVIHAYEDYFFDVRSRLQNKMWVTHALLSVAMRDGMTTANWDFFWKGLALWYGEDVLQAFWKFDELPEDVRAKIDAFNKSIQLKNVTKAHLVRPVTAMHAHDIIDEANTSAKDDKAGDAQNILMAGAGHMLDAVAFRIADQISTPSAIERPAITGVASDLPFNVPALPAGGIMATRKPVEPTEIPVADDDEDSSGAVKSEPVEDTPKPAAVVAPVRESTPVTLEEDVAEANARVREKKNAIIEKMRRKNQK